MSDVAVQASFNSGEWAPALFARVDIQKWRSGAALLENFFVDYRGGASNRPGTKYIIQALSEVVRLIPFQVTSTLGYMLEFGDFYIRFIFQGAMVLEDSFSITAATQAMPVVLTVTGHNFVVDDIIFVKDIVGMTPLNDRYFKVIAVLGATVTLGDLNGFDIDGTGFPAYASGGTAARVYKIASPYSSAQLAALKYAQTVNQMIICHPDFDPYVLTEFGPTDWTISPAVIGTTAATPGQPTITTTLAAGTANYSYVVTAVDGNGAESLPSDQGDLLNVQDLQTTAGSNSIDFEGEGGAAYYRVYKADVSYFGAASPGTVFGYIGYTSQSPFVDSNIAPDFSITPPQSINPFIPQGSVTAVNVTAPGAYTSFPTVTIIGSATTTATAYATLQVTGTPTVAAAGTGYAINDTITLSNGVVVVVNTIGGGGAVATYKAITVSPSNPGAIGPPGPVPANPRPQVSTSGGGTGATVNVTWGVGIITVSAPGAGYTSTPTVRIGAGLGGATATAVLTTSGNAHPTVPSFFQERLVLAASPDRPQTFWMSHPGQFFNFNQSNPIRPDDMIEGTLVSGVLNTIQSMQSQTSGLLMLTDNGSWIITGGSDGSAVSPSNIVARTQSYIGANHVRPIVANYDVLHVQQKGSSVRDLAFNIYFNVFTGSDISIISSHLFLGHQILEWAWAEEPYKLVWAIRDDGILLSCTFMKEQEFTAWTHHVTDGTYLSVATVTEQSGNSFIDAPYVAVSRDLPLPPPPPPPPPPTPCEIANVLDIISATPTIAVSLSRKLRAAYAGFAFRVARISDSATLDIGFDSDCHTDLAALLAFCAGTDGIIQILYDQSGNGNDLGSGAVNLTRPRVVTAGSVSVTIGTNNVLAAQMNGGHSADLRRNGGTSIGTSAGTVIVSANPASGSAGSSVASWWQLNSLCGVNNGNANGLSLNFGFVQGGSLYNPPSFQGTRYVGSWLGGHTDMFANIAVTYATDAIFMMRWDITDPTPTKVYINGSIPSTNLTATANDAPGSFATFVLGRGGQDSDQLPFLGNIGEAFVFDTELSISDTNILGDNINTYMGMSYTIINT